MPITLNRADEVVPFPLTAHQSYWQVRCEHGWVDFLWDDRSPEQLLHINLAEIVVRFRDLPSCTCDPMDLIQHERPLERIAYRTS